MSSVIYRGNLKLALDHLALAHRLEKQGDAKLARKIRDRARELDPSLRPRVATDSAMALDAATENAIIERAIRTARKSSAPRATSTKVPPMHRSAHGHDTDSLFQRDPNSRDLGPAFAAAWKQRNERRVSPRRARKAHAFDESHVDRDEALKHLDRLRNHVDVRAGRPEYDPKYVADCMMALVKALEVDGAEDDLDVEGQHEDYLRQGYTERELAGEDDVGEVPARSVVSTKDSRREVDHRRDFNSIAQGGADSALPEFDSAALFQR